MNRRAASLAFIVLASVSQAEDAKAGTNPIIWSLEQYEKVEKAPANLVTASHEKDQWSFSIPSNSSGYNFSQEMKKVVLRGDGFEIPIVTGNFFINTERTKFTINEKMWESAVLEIWMLTTSNLGSRAEHFRVKLSEILPKAG